MDPPLPFLLGTWRGRGRGEYPTIEAFEYEEESVFTAVPGKALIAYSQRTTRDGMPSHAESGFLRLVALDRVELVLAHPTGVVEVAGGTVSGSSLELASTSIATTATAKPVASLERSVEVDGELLRYTLRMAAVGQPLQHHLSAELHRS